MPLEDFSVSSIRVFRPLICERLMIDYVRPDDIAASRVPRNSSTSSVEGRRTSQSRGGPVHLNSNEAHLGIYELKLAPWAVLFLRGPSAQVSPPPFLFILFHVASVLLRRLASRSLYSRNVSIVVHALLRCRVVFSIVDSFTRGKRNFLNDNRPITGSSSDAFIVVSFVTLLVIFERNIKGNGCNDWRDY